MTAQHRESVYFVTGVTGMIGSEFLAQVLKEYPNAMIYVLIRAQDPVETGKRLDEILRFISTDFKTAASHRERVHAVCGDITQERLGMALPSWQEIARNVNYIVHAAASTAWDLPIEQARKSNVFGVSQVLELAHEAKKYHLKRLLHVSTAFVIGKKAGTISPEPLDLAAPVLDTYQASKREGEHLVRLAGETLPITIVRPTTVLGNAENGRTRTFDTLYYPMKLLYRGHKIVFPVAGDVTFDMVSSDWVARTMLVLMHSDHAQGRCFHAAAGDAAIPFNHVKQCVTDAMRKNHVTTKRVTLIPLWLWGLAIMPILSCLPSTRTLVKKMGLFIPYIRYRRVFDNNSTLKILNENDETGPKSVECYLTLLIRYAIQFRWTKTTQETLDASKLSSNSFIP